MDAAIIAIGSEMLTPQKVDTNSLYLTDQLNARGVEVVLKMVVGDDRQRLVQAMRDALRQAPLLILSGGLGPTEDDVTRDAVAELCGLPLEFRQEALDEIAGRFRQIQRPMAENNKRQAYLIRGAHMLSNARGTAPGQWVDCTVDGRPVHIVLLPGPPRELTAMWEATCLERLTALLPDESLGTRFYRVAGMGESDLDQLIAPVYTRYTNPATTILASLGDIQIHLRARCATSSQAETLLDELSRPILELLGDRVYSRNGDPLEAVIGQMLRDRALTLTLAESCTGGLVAERITSVPGSSDYFWGGFISYTYAAKKRLLGVDPDLLLEHKAVSEPVAQAMAFGALAATGANLALSVTGVAGPGQGDESAPVGTVFIGIASGESCQVRKLHFGGDRGRIRALAAQTALDLLRRHLLRHAVQ